MKKLTFYEQVGIVIPGAVLLFGLLFYYPTLKDLFTKDGISIGGLGIFILLSYAAGHAVAALGNIIEKAAWWSFGGFPSEWATKPKSAILSPNQIPELEARLKSRFGAAITVRGLDRATWQPISRQIYADVAKCGNTTRIDTFNGNYGLSRGLCASTLILAAVAAVHGDELIALALCGLAIIYLYRAYKFGVHFGRELYLQFLLLEDTRAKPVASKVSIENDGARDD